MITVIDNEYTTMGYDELDIGDGVTVPHVHVEVHKWSKRVLLDHVWPAVFKLGSHLKALGFDYSYAATEHKDVKVRKFQEMLGLSYYTECAEGVVLRRSNTVGGL
jgi:hypothetical protein